MSHMQKGGDCMASILNGKAIPFEDVFNDSVFILMSQQTPVSKDNKRTDDYDGQVYEVAILWISKESRLKSLDR